MEQNTGAGIAALFTGVFALVIWALVIFFLPCIGSLIYLFVRKIPRSKSGPPAA